MAPALTRDGNPFQRVTREVAKKRSKELEIIPEPVSNGNSLPVSPSHNGHHDQGRAARKSLKKITSRVRSGISALSATTINIHLLHFDSGTLVKNFKVRTKDSKESNLKRILAQFGLTSAILFNEDDKSPVTNIRAVTDGQTIVVASPLEEDPERRFVFYAGEELPGIATPLQGQALWPTYTESERRDHIVSLVDRQPEKRNYMRITEPYLVTKRNIQAVRDATAMQLETNYAAEVSRERIYRNWGEHFAIFFPESLQYEASEKMLALLAILAKATPGQDRLVKEILVELKGTDGYDGAMNETWVIKAIELIYRKARLTVGAGLLV